MGDATMPTLVVNSMEEALRLCDFSDGTLGSREKEDLDRLGDVVFLAVVGREGLERLRAAGRTVQHRDGRVGAAVQWLSVAQRDPE